MLCDTNVTLVGGRFDYVGAIDDMNCQAIRLRAKLRVKRVFYSHPVISNSSSIDIPYIHNGICYAKTYRIKGEARSGSPTALDWFTKTLY